MTASQSAATLLLMIGLSSCVPRQPPEPLAPPPEPPPKILQEEELKPIERPDIVISNFDEHVSEDHKTATVIGTLINRGNGATRKVVVTVTALDKEGRELESRDATPSTQRIAAGSSATFFVSFERRPEIDQYHVEAISR